MKAACEEIAVISDIHGNLPALEQVLEDIAARGITRIICLGDIIGKGPNPSECVDRLLPLCEGILRGNWEHMLVPWKDRRFLQWQLGRLGPERIALLSALPIHLSFRMSGRRIRLCHASPHDLFHRVFPQTPEHERLQLFDAPDDREEPADVIGYGDIHGAYVEHFVHSKGKVIFNAGSIGNPLEVTQASYAILEGVPDSIDPAPFSIALVRVPYDIEEAVRLAETSGMPHVEEYAEELRTGRYRKRDLT